MMVLKVFIMIASRSDGQFRQDYLHQLSGGVILVLIPSEEKDVLAVPMP